MELVIKSIYILNSKYGQNLNDGLENRLDQVSNLLDIQLKEMFQDDHGTN